VCAAAVVEGESGLSVQLLCQEPAADGQPLGGPCTGEPGQCREHLCLIDAGECSRLCRTDADCGDGRHCSLVPFFKPIPELADELVSACVPGKRCLGPGQCPAGQDCSAADLVPPPPATPAAAPTASPFCREEVAGGQALGAPCAADRECLSGLCGVGNVCSRFCQVDAQCPAAGVCAPAPFALPYQDTSVPIDAESCYPGCQRRRDCADGLVCAGQVIAATISTFCYFANEGGREVGQACARDDDCLTAWCFREGDLRYCTEFCAADGDCPGGVSCYDFEDGRGHTWKGCAPD